MFVGPHHHHRAARLSVVPQRLAPAAEAARAPEAWPGLHPARGPRFHSRRLFSPHRRGRSRKRYSPWKWHALDAFLRREEIARIFNFRCELMRFQVNPGSHGRGRQPPRTPRNALCRLRGGSSTSATSAITSAGPPRWSRRYVTFFVLSVRGEYLLEKQRQGKDHPPACRLGGDAGGLDRHRAVSTVARTSRSCPSCDGSTATSP